MKPLPIHVPRSCSFAMPCPFMSRGAVASPCHTGGARQCDDDVGHGIGAATVAASYREASFITPPRPARAHPIPRPPPVRSIRHGRRLSVAPSPHHGRRVRSRQRQRRALAAHRCDMVGEKRDCARCSGGASPRCSAWAGGASSLPACPPHPQLKQSYWFMLVNVVNNGMVSRRWA